jgi:hypothetical protein
MRTLRYNYWAILVLVLLGQIIPAIWYMAFSDRWLEYNNLTLQEAESVGSAPYITAVITSVAHALVLAWLFKRMKIESAVEGLKTAVIMGIPFSLLNHMTVNMFSLRPYPLTWIEGGADLSIWAAMGLILGGWLRYKPETGADQVAA